MNLKQNSTYYSRFKGSPWFDKLSSSKVIIFGQGGIGSWLSLFLARTGTLLTVVDFDTVEEENIAGQLYGSSSIGKLKVDAITDNITLLCGLTSINKINEKVEANKVGRAKALIPYFDVVCVSFDSIAARQIVYEYWKEHGKSNSLFVDGRMSIENGQVFTVVKGNNDSIKQYEASFFNDNEVVQASCTTKATSHCGAFIAALMTSQITNYITNLDPNNMERQVSNQLDFNLPLAMFEQINDKENVFVI